MALRDVAWCLGTRPIAKTRSWRRWKRNSSIISMNSENLSIICMNREGQLRIRMTR